MYFRELTDHLFIERVCDGWIDIVRIGMVSETSLLYSLYAIFDREESLRFRYSIPIALEKLHLRSLVLARLKLAKHESKNYVKVVSYSQQKVEEDVLFGRKWHFAMRQRIQRIVHLVERLVQSS